MLALSSSQSANADVIRREVLAAGYDERMARALIANSYAESGLSNGPPDGDNGHSIGLFQLNDNGGAGTGMTVEQRRDPSANTRKILSDYGMARVVELWRAGADAPELARQFCIYVERPANKEQKGAERAEICKQLFGASTVSTPPHYTEDIRDILADALGQPYWYGAGGLDCPWPVGGPGGGASAPYGFDCSGWVLRAWQHLGLVWKKTPVGRTARDIAAFVERVEIGEQMPGDVACYASDGSTVSHVQLVVSPPDPALGGHSICYGANGGGSDTHGTDPEACVKEAAGNYWSKFVFYGRVPQSSVTLARFVSHLVLGASSGMSVADSLGLDPSLVPDGLEQAISAYAKKLYPSGW